jgi:hypothetical protein
VLRCESLAMARRWLGVGNTETAEAGAATATVLRVALFARSSAVECRQADGVLIDEAGSCRRAKVRKTTPPRICDGAKGGYRTTEAQLDRVTSLSSAPVSRPW